MSTLGQLSADVARHAQSVHALRERVDYLTVAVMRGDPRFCRAEHASANFDCAAFDMAWAAKGKRVPPHDEVFGPVGPEIAGERA